MATTRVEYRVAYDAAPGPVTYELHLADPASLAEATSRLKSREQDLREAFYTNVRVQSREVTESDWEDIPDAE